VWGSFEVTEAGNKEFVTNFNAHVYQKHIALDAEHETKVSGAVGYLEELSMNDDGSVEAAVDWTPRGKKLIAEDAFKFISPEWYEQWTDPATQQEYENVIIGGALTTRPFFKGLRSLVANEDGMYDMEDGDEEGTLVGLVDVDLQAAIVSAAKEEFGNIMGENLSAVSLHDDHVIVSNGSGMYYRLEYTAADDEIEFTQRPAEAVWEAAERSRKEDDQEKNRKKIARKKNSNSKEDNVAELEEMVKAAEGIKDEKEKESFLSKIATALGINVTVTQDEDDGDDDDGDDADDDDKDDSKKASEQVTSLTAQLVASEKARKASDERLGVLETASRKARYRDIILGRDEASVKKAKEDGATPLHPMVGDLDAKLQIMESLEEGSDAFQAYIAGERENANRLHEVGTFAEVGINSTDGNVEASVAREFQARVATLRKDDKELSEADAITRIAKEDPNLYAKYDKVVTGRKSEYPVS